MQWSLNWLDYIACGLSILAAFTSFNSNRIAKRSLALSEKQEKQKEQPIKLLLQGSFSKTRSDCVYYMFSMLANNPSSADNSLSACELEITYKRKNGSLGNLFLHHEPNAAKELGLVNVTALNIPCDLKAHSSAKGIAIFKLDSRLCKEIDIESYNVIFKDVINREIVISTAMIGNDAYE